jgi:type IV pilus assembly protein PilM
MKVLQALGALLPPPMYMQMPAIGVDISDTSLKFIEFQTDKKSGKELTLKNWGDIDIAEGALNRGVVHDGSKLTEALRQVREKTGVEHVRVSLPEERAYLFETQIEYGTSPTEVRNLLEFRLEENVPLSPKDAFFDYDVLEVDAEHNLMQVSVTAYAKDTVMSYYDACKAASVIPLSFEIEAQAIARATIKNGDNATHMIVDFGKTRTGVGIVHKGVLMYTSTIDVGGGELSKAMREKLGDVPESELTQIKNTQGLVPGGGNKEIHDILVKAMGNIVDEIGTRITYWNTKDVAHEDRQIQSVILCGGSVNMKGLPAYLTKTLNVQVYRADVWQNAFSIEETVPEIERRFSFGYATAIGLALATTL